MDADEGIRVWCNAGETAEVPGLLEMLERLRERVPGLMVTLTTTRSVELPDPLPEHVRYQARPFDIAPSVERFVSEHRPEILVVTGADIFATAVSACRQRGVPVILINARSQERSGIQKRLSDFRIGGRLRAFTRILTVRDEDSDYFVRRGALRTRIEVAGMLEASCDAPFADLDEVEHLAKLMASRPVWLAAAIPPLEFSAVERAFRIANGQAHRLLLVLTPSDAGAAEAAFTHFETAGWTTVRREDGEEPDLDVQVYIADAPDEEGVWYRLAPVSYLGGTLSRTPFPDPFAPAALGSAILHGTQLAARSSWLERLVAGGACRAVSGADDLGAAVSDLLSPDHAAQMAARAWDVASQAAASAERVAGVIHEILVEGVGS
ncbi:MAG: glycosyltransferase N-terminal domain-containing protein [Pseudomonadota bacterium]